MAPALRFFSFDALFGLFDVATPNRTTAEPRNLAETDQQRRAFIADALETNASAFSSEQDVAQLMSHFPREF